MLLANIQDIETYLSHYLTLVSKGEEVIICNYGEPIAIIKQYQLSQKPRQLGLLKGKIQIAEDFDEVPTGFA
jgi:antitoxin (DNA-binding transcriptional repressor) of toxin-antitoxin stability system